MKKYIYVDYENINNLSSLVYIDGKYFFFIGASQKNISSDLVKATNNKVVEWIKISGNGNNALDFHIIYTLAMNTNLPDIEHVVLSKDTGFDPLLATLKEKNIHVRRITSLKDIHGNVRNHTDNDVVDKIINNLKKIIKTKRPQSVKKLEAHIRSFEKMIDDIRVHEIIEELYRRHIISSGSGSRIKYTD